MTRRMRLIAYIILKWLADKKSYGKCDVIYIALVTSMKTF